MPSKKIGMLFTFLDSALLPQLLNGLYGEGGNGMSVLIKGMEMPKTCEECDFCHWSNLHQTGRCDRCDDEPVCADFGTDYKRTRARFCPLVEVPTPHGRLIDADELVRIWTGAKFYGNIKPIVDVRPTVIEAEGVTK